MAQRSEKLRDVLLADVKAHPEIITDLLAGDGDVSVVLEKHGNTAFKICRTTDFLQDLRRELTERQEPGTR